MHRSNPWVQIFKPQENAIARLICFPFAGGGAQSFSKWPDHLPDGIELLAVQLPGRETRMRETPLSDVDSLLDAMLPEVQGYLDRPFILYGHSMGALIAYEFARRLQGMSLAPECLMVSARVAPHRRPPREPINKLPQAEFVEALRHLHGTPEEVLEDSDLMALISPMLRADFAINEEYVHAAEPRLDCNILAFGGLRDSEAGRQGMDDWREVTDGEFGLRMVPGDHFFIQTAQTLFLRMLSIEIYQQTRVAWSNAHYRANARLACISSR